MAKQRKKEMEGDAGLEALAACEKASKGTKSRKASPKAKSGGKTVRRAKSDGKKTSVHARSKKGAKHGGPGRTYAVRLAVLAVVVLVLGTLYCLDFSRVTSNAMMPTLAEGDLVVSWAPRWVNVGYEPGDVVWVNENSSEVAPNFLRLVAKDEAEISYNNDKVRINGVSLERRLLTNDAIVRAPEEPEIWRESLSNGASWRIMLPQQGLYGDNAGRVALKSNDMFLIGDNRMASYDSRQRGVYTREQVQGRALFVLDSARDDALLGHFIKPL